MTSGNDTTTFPDPQIPESTRWSAVSASRNADHHYKLFVARDPAKAYEFVCMYNPPFAREYKDEDDEDEEDEDGEEEGEETGNSNETSTTGNPGPTPLGTKAMDGKPAAEYPTHPYTISRAGRLRLRYIRQMADVRNPAIFGMYTYGDHVAYGALEVVENVLLDYEEAATTDTRERWAICEGLASFLAMDGTSLVCMCDDGDRIDQVCMLVGRMFLDILCQLEREGFLRSDSEIPNLGMVMGLFIVICKQMRDYELLEDSRPEYLLPVKEDNNKKWRPHEFDKYILAYARKYGIKLVGPARLDSLIANMEERDVPVLESSGNATDLENADVFGFAEALDMYMDPSGGFEEVEERIGGDKLDITAWSSAKRKEAAFDNKDPLGERELDALREGKVFSLA